MKVLFHTNTLNYRGTTVAVADYAKYNQDILGNESIIAYCKTNGTEKDMGNENIVIGELKKKFKSNHLILRCSERIDRRVSVTLCNDL